MGGGLEEVSTILQIRRLRWPCRCIAVIAGSNTAEGMDVHPLGLLCVV